MGSNRTASVARPPTWRRLSARAIGRFIAAIVLIAAAAMKEYRILSRGYGPGESWVMLLVIVEAVIGLWLLSFWFADVSHYAAITCFAGFVGASAYLTIVGARSCGCFGAVNTGPAAITMLDAGVLVLLLATSRVPARWSVRSRGPALSICLMAGFAGVGVARWDLLRLRSPAVTEVQGAEIRIISQGGVTVLSPSKWIGSAFPLFDFVSDSVRLRHGTWRLVFYRHNCSDCQRHLPMLLSENVDHLAFVEVPPYSRVGEDLIPPSRADLHHTLANDREWFIETPTEIDLNDGRVAVVHVGLATKSGKL